MNKKIIALTIFNRSSATGRKVERKVEEKYINVTYLTK